MQLIPCLLAAFGMVLVVGPAVVHPYVVPHYGDLIEPGPAKIYTFPGTVHLPACGHALLLQCNEHSQKAACHAGHGGHSGHSGHPVSYEGEAPKGHYEGSTGHAGVYGEPPAGHPAFHGYHAFHGGSY